MLRPTKEVDQPAAINYITTLNYTDVILKSSYFKNSLLPSVHCNLESCIIIKIKLNFYFHFSLWSLKRFYWDVKGRHKTFCGTTKKCENKNLSTFSCFVLWTYFTRCSSVSIVNFEQINASRVVLQFSHFTPKTLQQFWNLFNVLKFSMFLSPEILITNKYGNMFSYFFKSKRGILDTSVTHLRLSFFPKKSMLVERTGP